MNIKKMSLKKFTMFMNAIELFENDLFSSNYCYGYRYGLRRFYHGDKFGDDEKIEKIKLKGGDISKANPSKYGFLGLGRWMFGKMMKNKNVTSLVELRQIALDLGVKMYTCQTSMEVMEIPRETLIDEVADIVGVAFMLEQAQQSDFTLFI